MNEVDARIATGVGSRRPPKMKKFQERDVEKILRYGAKAIGVRISGFPSCASIDPSM